MNFFLIFDFCPQQLLDFSHAIGKHYFQLLAFVLLDLGDRNKSTMGLFVNRTPLMATHRI